MARYTARVMGEEFTIVTSDDGTVEVNGVPVEAELRRTPQGTVLRVGTRVYSLRMLEALPDSDLRRVAIDGRVLGVDIEDETAALLRSMQVGKATKVQHSVLRSPMPGKIAKILVQEGELIEQGQGVIILEAMKMENEIQSPTTGIVKSLKVREGTAVEKNGILIEFS